MILLLRIFAPAPDAAAAGQTGRRLLDVLAVFSPAPVESPRQYWKVPEWYEHTLRLSPGNELGFDAVLELGAGGWSHVVRDGECSAVWNPVPGSRFPLAEATWAEVLLNHLEPPAED